MKQESTISIPEGIDNQRIIVTLAKELTVKPGQIKAAIGLLDEGATVPFIARYRKEATGGLDDTVLRELEHRLRYLRDLEERRLAVLASINEQGKLNEALAAQINEADTKQRIEDLYAPFRPKRRTRAQIAREAGLDKLVKEILLNHQQDPIEIAAKYSKADTPFSDARAALNGARDILSELYADNADLIASLRDKLWQRGYIYSSVVSGQEQAGANFRDWFNYMEPLKNLPSHRVLALLRGRQQGFLSLKIALDPESEDLTPHPFVKHIANFLRVKANFSAKASPQSAWLADVCRWTWRVKLLTSLETEFITRLRETAETEAIKVFANNLKDLLLSAPAGSKAVLGLDPGIRTGVKVAAIDSTGKVLETATIFPFEPKKDVAGSLSTLKSILEKHDIKLVAIGNGTASRETQSLVSQLAQQNPKLNIRHVTVSEAGASVYSASEQAAKELPNMDVSLRGAVSIARRLQDPLAELVKIEPRAIGVGQYQHDVNQRQLANSLDVVIEDCVNAVGVDVNTASAELLGHVSGLNSTVARNIVEWREQNGMFKTRKSLLHVPRFGPKAFEQAAGFLRINNGDNPLDASAVHPEAYGVANKILEFVGCDAASITRNPEHLKNISPEQFTDDKFGVPTVKDILKELEKPGRDPRPEFKTASFAEGVKTISDLNEGMQLEGVVTNVANFGAFVDIGVGQDGLVHISQMASHFVKDPRDVVRVGQIIKVEVIEVDTTRKRVSLTMRTGN